MNYNKTYCNVKRLTESLMCNNNKNNDNNDNNKNHNNNNNTDINELPTYSLSPLHSFYGISSYEIKMLCKQVGYSVTYSISYVNYEIGIHLTRSLAVKGTVSL